MLYSGGNRVDGLAILDCFSLFMLFPSYVIAQQRVSSHFPNGCIQHFRERTAISKALLLPLTLADLSTIQKRNKSDLQNGRGRSISSQLDILIPRRVSGKKELQRLISFVFFLKSKWTSILEVQKICLSLSLVKEDQEHFYTTQPLPENILSPPSPSSSSFFIRPVEVS